MIMDEDALAEMVKVMITKATAHHDELRVLCVAYREGGDGLRDTRVREGLP
jgi:hypothetical protein